MSTPTRPVVLLVTCSLLPDGEEYAGTTHLLDAFTARGVAARWVVWDDPSVDWSEGLVAVRSTWDYETRREQFLAWARSVPRMLNSAAVFEWNTDKAYLPQLSASGVSVVPTIVVRLAAELAAVVTEVSTASPAGLAAVVKPSVGAGGRGVVLVEGAGPWTRHGSPGLDPAAFGSGPWVVQPLVQSVRTEGETSVFVLDGRSVSAARKVPAAGEIRVHEQYGGATVAVPLSGEAADLARRTVDAASALLGERLDYARVDSMRLDDGTLAVSELEVTEPGLYLELLPDNAAAFADLVLARLLEQ